MIYYSEERNSNVDKRVGDEPTLTVCKEKKQKIRRGVPIKNQDKKNKRIRGEIMAKENNTEKKITELFLPIVGEKGFELADVEFVKEGPNWYLRVYIDKEGGITIDDCEMVSRTLEKKMDEADPIQQAYILEVSSPGIDRPLKKPEDFVKYAGEIVDIKLYKPLEGSKEFQGELKGMENKIITILNEKGQELQFAQKDVASIRLAVIF